MSSYVSNCLSSRTTTFPITTVRQEVYDAEKISENKGNRKHYSELQRAVSPVSWGPFWAVTDNSVFDKVVVELTSMIEKLEEKE